MTVVKLSELLYGFEFSSMNGGVFEEGAYLCRKTGAVYCVADDESLNVDLPEDLETSDQYISLPNKNELNLGRNLVFSFVKNVIPSDFETVRGFFNGRGAYAYFKGLLDQRELIDEWFAFEQAETEKALRLWCEENGFEVED